MAGPTARRHAARRRRRWRSPPAARTRRPTAPADEGTPEAGGVYNYPIRRTRSASTPLDVQRARAGRSSTTPWKAWSRIELDEDGGDEGRAARSPRAGRRNEDASVWTFKLKQGVTFAAPVSREVVAQDFVDSWNSRDRPRRTAPTPRTSSRRSRAPTTAATGTATTASPGSRRSTTTRSRSRCATRSPSSRRPWATPSPRSTPVDYIERDRRQGVQPQAGRHRSVHGPGVGQQPVGHAGKEPGLLGQRRTPAYLDAIDMKIIPEDHRRSGSSSRRAPSTTPTSRRGRSARRREQCPRSGTASGRPRRGLSSRRTSYGINMNNPMLGTPAGDKGLAAPQGARRFGRHAERHQRGQRGRLAAGHRLVPEGIPGSAPTSRRTPYDPEARPRRSSRGLGTMPTLSVQVQHRPGPPEDRRGAAGRLEGRPASTSKLANFEWGTYLDMLAKSEKGDSESAQIFRMGWLADYPSMDNFLYPLFHSSQSADHVHVLQQPRVRRPGHAGPSDRRTQTQRTNLYLPGREAHARRTRPASRSTSTACSA